MNFDKIRDRDDYKTFNYKDVGSYCKNFKILFTRLLSFVFNRIIGQ